MRKRQTFLLTIMTPENGAASFCGRVKVISSGKTCTFTTLDELNGLISSEMSEEENLQGFPESETALLSGKNGSEEKGYSPA